jgi:hypothetical protein
MCGICGEIRFDGCAADPPTTVAMIDPGYVDALLADPDRRFAGQGDRLWHLGVLEMWLQAHGIGG